MGGNRENQYENPLFAALGHAVRIFRFVSILLFSASGNMAAQPISAWFMDHNRLRCARSADYCQHGALLYPFAPQSIGGGCKSGNAADFV